MKTLLSLKQERFNILTQINALKNQLIPIDQEIFSRYESQIRAIYEREEKQHGSVTLLSDEGIPLKGDIDKKVKWKSDALMNIAREMSWEEAQRVFKITFEVPEKTYKTLSNELREKVDQARETTYGDLKVSIKEE